MVTTELQEFIRRVNDAFVRHDTAVFDANLADDVRWTMVGSPAIEGKAAFIAEVMSMAEGPAPDLSVTNVITHGTAAAVEGTMTMIDESGARKTYAFCDVYRMSGSKNGKIKEITAYLIELNAGAAS